MLRIERSGNGETVFTLSGRMEEDDIGELETLIRTEANRVRIVLDLKDLFTTYFDIFQQFPTVKRCLDNFRRFSTPSSADSSPSERF